MGRVFIKQRIGVGTGIGGVLKSLEQGFGELNNAVKFFEANDFRGAPINDLFTNGGEQQRYHLEKIAQIANDKVFSLYSRERALRSDLEEIKALIQRQSIRRGEGKAEGASGK